MKSKLEQLMAAHKENPIVMKRKVTQAPPKQTDEPTQIPAQVATQDSQQNKAHPSQQQTFNTEPAPATATPSSDVGRLDNSQFDNSQLDNGVVQDQPSSNHVPPVQTAPSNTAETKPAFVPVNVNILGTPHRIVCPRDGIPQLEEGVSFINGKMRSIRQEMKGKVPTNEELLLLVCLEMHDQIKSLQDSEDYYTSERDEALALIDKILKNTKVA